MQITPIQQQNKQPNFTSTVFIKNCSKIFKSKSVQNQISRLEKNGKSDIVSLKAYQSHQDGAGVINMNIINHDTCEEREKNFSFKKGELKLGLFYKRLLKDEPTVVWIL